MIEIAVGLPVVVVALTACWWVGHLIVRHMDAEAVDDPIEGESVLKVVLGFMALTTMTGVGVLAFSAGHLLLGGS
jgi:hypothetical protein